jgi:hypothetical protein
MANPNGDIREHVLQEMRGEIRRLASEGSSAEQIERNLDGRWDLSEAEQGLIELLTYHAVAEFRGYYSPVQLERGGIKVTLGHGV